MYRDFFNIANFGCLTFYEVVITLQKSDDRQINEALGGFFKTCPQDYAALQALQMVR